MGIVVTLRRTPSVYDPADVFSLVWGESAARDAANLCTVDDWLVYRCPTFEDAFVVLRVVVKKALPQRAEAPKPIFVQHYCALRRLNPMFFNPSPKGEA